MGLIYSAKGDYIRALVFFERALHLLQAAYGEDNQKNSLMVT
jgi:hypothetical protein